MSHFGKRLVALAGLLYLLGLPAAAHEVEHCQAVVIDTDMGLDDAVTLAMALQSERVDIVAIVASEGAAGADKAVEHLERMLDLFNRSEIPLYAPAQADEAGEAPPFREFAERAVGRVLPPAGRSFRRPFSAKAYASQRGKTVVLALGPLSNLAAALRSDPEIRERVAEVIFAGSPVVNESWNAGYDPKAFEQVVASGIELEFVMPAGLAARKPDRWRSGELSIGQGTSIGERFFKRLLSTPEVRRHYTERFENFYDELAFLHLIDQTLFEKEATKDVLVPNDRGDLVELFGRLISEGRQHRERVVFVEGSLPDEVLQQDVRRRKAQIIAKNGETEWFAQLVLNELHQHLGAYSVIGVKMGLWAAELLNAPQHEMRVFSHVPPSPPVGCLNDGVIVATGSTPGRGLFTLAAAKPDTLAVGFEYNGRRITLALKSAYREKVESAIAASLAKHTLEDHEYWADVRRFGLMIWQDWHRRDLFELMESTTLRD